MVPTPPTSTRFPCTTLFRSESVRVLQLRHELESPLAPGSRLLESEVLERSVATDSERAPPIRGERKSTRLNSSHVAISYAVFCLKKKRKLDKAQKLLFKLMC